MLITVKEAAELLQTSERTIQLKCKRFKVKKIANVYQLTKEIVDQWQTETKTETNRTSQNVTRKTTSSKPSFLFIISIILGAVLTFVVLSYFFDLKDQISTKDKTIIANDSVHKIEVNAINKRLDDSIQVMYKLRLENRVLRIKDSIRLFKRN
jgi:predicted PurR-regulated permease PerM